MSALDNLPTLDQVRASRSLAQPKGPSRLQQTVAAKPLVTITEKEFRRIVTQRDKHFCRMCGRKVKATLARIPERQEVHHIHGRTGDLRFEDRAALTTCMQCHEKLTGRVNERWAIVATKTFTMRQGTFTDARHPVTFERVA